MNIHRSSEFSRSGPSQSKQALWFVFLSAFFISVFSTPRVQAEAASITPAPTAEGVKVHCLGEYADELSSLSAKAREAEQQQATYTFYIRAAATYDCPSYDAEGRLQLAKKRALMHGTAFAYRHQGVSTLLLTNHHVAKWPAVTDAEHPVQDVPLGCRRVSETVRIVDKETDNYEADDIPLFEVESDLALDTTILRAKISLPTIPWKIGKSHALTERNVVNVRGFPLGAFKANNVGKVVSASDYDNYRDWEHEDFVVDALLSPGNAGSPVLAISCETGQFELVGVYHTDYSRGSPLNLVIGIDQLSGMMQTLKRPSARSSAWVADTSALGRAKLASHLRDVPQIFFPFGAAPASARLRKDGAVLFEIYGADFPFKGFPVAVIEDLPADRQAEFGNLGRVWFGNVRGFKARQFNQFDKASQALVERLLDGLRQTSMLALTYELHSASANISREASESLFRFERALKRQNANVQALSQSVLELAEHFAPLPVDVTTPLAEVLLYGGGPNPSSLVTSPTARKARPNARLL